MVEMRTESDSLGMVEVPADKLWGAQTQRSLEHFKISSEKMPPELVAALASVKRAAARVNLDLGVLDDAKAVAIMQAADEVLQGKHAGEFPLALNIFAHHPLISAEKGAPAASSLMAMGSAFERTEGRPVPVSTGVKTIRSASLSSIRLRA